MSGVNINWLFRSVVRSISANFLLADAALEPKAGKNVVSTAFRHTRQLCPSRNKPRERGFLLCNVLFLRGVTLRAFTFYESINYDGIVKS